MSADALIKTFGAILIGGLFSLVAWAGNTISQKAENNRDSLRHVERRLAKEELEKAKMLLQQAETSKELNRVLNTAIPIVTDTVWADSVVQADTTRDST